MGYVESSGPLVGYVVSNDSLVGCGKQCSPSGFCVKYLYIEDYAGSSDPILVSVGSSDAPKTVMLLKGSTGSNEASRRLFEKL